MTSVAAGPMEIDGQSFPEMQCTCGAGACIVQTSRTEKNPGRKFYCCPAIPGRRCGFFAWCDIASPSKRMKTVGAEPMEIDGQSFPEMQCTCGAGACIVQTSRTEKNPGRKFYSCPGILGRRCGFFAWCDIASPLKRVIPESEGAGSSTIIQQSVNPCQAQLGDSRNNPVNHRSLQIAQKDMCFNCQKCGHWARDCPEKAKSKKEQPAVRTFNCQYLPEMECRCGAGTCLIQMSKTEKNPGRKFYRCPGEDGRDCHFFAWCDTLKTDQNCDVPLSSYPMCSCGAGICRIEVVKDGKDMGQKVFVCPVKQGQGACNFYQLLDSSRKTASSTCLEESHAFSSLSVSNAQEDTKKKIDDVIEELGGSKLERVLPFGSPEEPLSREGSKLEAVLPSGSPEEPLSRECDTSMTIDTDGLGSGVLNAYFLSVENLNLNKCSSSESDDKLEESTETGNVKHIQKDCTGSPRPSFFKWEKLSCFLEFDGASKGNPGQAGAGAVLRAEDGSIVCRLREGVGIATNNVAEYRALILGLKYALKKGFTQIRAQGDSQLVCKQVEGQWKTKNPNMFKLCNEAKELKDKFSSFHIFHVVRAGNWEADAQANLAVHLADGEVQEECGY